MIKKITILSNIFLILTMVNAQIPNQTNKKIVDSLFTILPKAEGIAKVDILNQISLQLAPRNYDSSFRFATEALNLSEELNYPKGKGIAIFNLGNSYYFKSDLNNALTNYLIALRILEPYEPLKELGDLLIQLGALNQYVRNTEKVFDYYHHAARNFIAIGDSTTAIFVYHLLGRSYLWKYMTLWIIDSMTKEEMYMMMDSAIKFNDIALHYYLNSKPNYKWYSKEAWLANIYDIHGVYYLARDDSVGLFYLFKALEASKMIKDDNRRNIIEGVVYSNLGYYYYFQYNNHKKGVVEYAALGIERLKKTDRYDMYANALSILGEIEMDKGRFQSSEKFLKQSLDVSHTFLLKVNQTDTPDPTFRLWGVTQLRYFRSLIFNDLISLYELTGDFKNALFYQKQLEVESKILTLDELNRQIMGLQVNYENDLHNEQFNLLSKEKELADLKLSRGRQWFTGAGGTVVIVFLLILLYFQRKKYSTEQNALLLKQRLLRSQMNPHFIFNSLSGIQNFIITEKPTKASIYLSKFATLVRNILDSSVKEYITLEKEITTIENYLELQKIRYANKFDFSIKTDDAIDPETTLIPPMLAQPFIENAIEHGIVHSEKTGQIDVEFKLENDVILFEVRDNGVGREKAKELEAHLEKDHQSMSTSITLERLAMLNKKRKHKIIFEITDLKDSDGKPAGTFVRFGIPLG